MQSLISNNYAIVKNAFLQPFPIYFECCDYHFILYIKDHPEYEAVEAFIRERNCREPYIRVIITRNDQTQIDFINDKHVVSMLTNRKRKREVLYSPIEFTYNFIKGKPHIIIKFKSQKSENFLVDFYTAAKASTKHSRLINPGKHSISISLPVMYPERTTMAGAKSCVTIDGVNYYPPVEKYIPLFFKGMKGYYSEVFNIGVIRAGTEVLKLVQAPTSLSIGEKWIYELPGGLESYEIVNIKDKELQIHRSNETITAEIEDNSIKIKNITYHSKLENVSAEYRLEFQPSLPVSNIFQNKQEVGFSISINNHMSLVTGTVIIEADKNKASYTLLPQEPQWSICRAVTTTLEVDSDTFKSDTSIGITKL